MATVELTSIDLTLLELWAIRDYVRRVDRLGEEWDKDFNERIYRGLLDVIAVIASDKTDKDGREPTVAVQLTQDELWRIDRQIPASLQFGTAPTGRNLLVKVMRCLVELRAAAENSDPACDTLVGLSEEVAKQIEEL